MNQAYEQWKSTQPTELPEGFVKVSVLLTQAEAERLHGKAVLTGDGTYSAAVRREMGKAEVPNGLKKAVKRMMEESLAGDDA